VPHQTFPTTRNGILLAKVIRYRDAKAKILDHPGWTSSVAPEKYPGIKSGATGTQEMRGYAVSFILTPEPTLSG